MALLNSLETSEISSFSFLGSVISSFPLATGSGKTLIAEYLIEKFLKEDKRIIHTSPIKALSNQKYRDFKDDYGEKIGILTGDVAINERAPVLIMTTEIFRNMLFNDIEALDGVKYVVFDEVHYITDIDRGVIWEESIIFAPDDMRFLALSATVPNEESLAGWIQKIKGHQVDIVKHIERPVPLQLLAYDEKNGLLPLDTFKRTIKFRSKSGKGKDIRPFPFSFYKRLIEELQKNNDLPALFFIFSRGATSSFALETYRYFSFSTPDERKEIAEIFDNIIGDEKLLKIENIQKIRRLVIEGIGVHNAGLLPILKEAVEELFTRRLLKMLFVTETFALGVNMPAKTVIFHSLEKYDGYNFRYLMSREFFQMAGRAGRRGIDEYGKVITIIPRTLDKKEFLRVTSEKLEPLDSRFKLSYNTILNLIESYSPEEIENLINKSFQQYNVTHSKDILYSELKAADEIIDPAKNDFPPCSDVSNMKKFFSSKDKVDYTRRYLKNVDREIKKLKARHKRKKKYSERDWALKKYDEYMLIHSELMCTNCEHKEDCIKKYREFKNAKHRSQKLRKELRGFNSVDQLKLFKKKKELLTDLGYLRGNSITARGEIGTQVYGYELIVSEILFEGLFDIAPEKLINMILGAIIYEKPKKISMPRGRHADIEYRRIIKRVEKIAHRVRSLEKVHLGDKISPILSKEIMPLVEQWCDGVDFEELLDSFPMEGGDIIRLFRGIIDLLRQLIRITKEHRELCDKFKYAMDMMDHGIVSLSFYLRASDHDEPQKETEDESI